MDSALPVTLAYFDRRAYAPTVRAAEAEATFLKLLTSPSGHPEINNQADVQALKTQSHTLTRLARDLLQQRTTRVQASANESSRRFRMGLPSGAIMNEWIRPVSDVTNQKVRA